MLEIKYDDAKIKRLQRELKNLPRALPKIMSRALNRTALSARTEVSRSLAGRIGLRIKDVRQRVVMQKASYSNWRSAIRISSRRLPIIRFGARQTAKGVTYKQGRQRVLIRHAFIATMPSGHRGIFKRKGGARLPIAELRGPSLAQVFTGAQDEANRIYQASLARLEKNVNDQVNLILRKKLPA